MPFFTLYMILGLLLTRLSFAATSILVPLYQYPSTGAWDPLFRAIESCSQQPFTIIINPSSGPGETQVPDDTYISAISRLNSLPNVRLIGYTNVLYCSRSIEEVCADIDTYASWSSYKSANIKLSGVFLDEAPAEVGSGEASLQYMADLQARVKKSFGASGFTMTNPGAISDKQFYAFADSIVSYEDVLENYYDEDKLQTSQDLTMSAGTPAGMQGIIVTSFTGSESRERYLLGKVVERGIGHVYFTRDADYMDFGSDLGILVEEISKRNGLSKRKMVVKW